MKFLFDIFPVLLFFLAFKLYDIFIATAVAIVAAIAQIGWLWLRKQQIEKMMWINLAIIVVLGGATLLAQDETFIKWKPTVLYWLIASVLLVSSLVFRKNLIKLMLEKQIILPVAVWDKLNLSWIVFFLLMGGVNLYVAFSFSVDVWVTFKLFGATGMMLVFIILQVMVLGKHLKPMPERIQTVNEQNNPIEEMNNKTGKKR